jgi:histidyl-tRNA synthetase
VGISIGIERLFVIIEDKYKQSNEILKERTQVFVASVGKGMD